MIGDNGVLTQSQQAAKKTNKATEAETIQLAIAGSFNDEGNLDLAMLVNNLNNEMKVGTQVVTEKDNENNDIFPVTVKTQYGMYQIDEVGNAENISGVILNETNLKIFAGSTATLTATVSSNLVGKTVTWSTEDASIADIDVETGESVTITAGASGSTTITAQVEGGEKIGTCMITIVQAVSTITLDNTILEIKQGEKATLTATVSPETNVEDIKFVIDGTANEAGAYFGTVGTLTKTVPVGNNGIVTVEVNVPENATIDKTTTIRVQGNNTGNVNGKVGTRTIKVIENILTLGDPINANKYGWKVNEYISNAEEDNEEEIGWRLFYQDINNTYIIADKPQGSYKPNDYSSSSQLGSIGKGLNSIYYSEYPTQFKSRAQNVNAVAWMTDPTKWLEYTDSNGNNSAKWAIASPSIELLVASFNADAENDDQTLLATPTVENYGYINSWYGDMPFSVDYNNGIYNYSSDPNESKGIWWICSPANHHMSQYGGLSCLVMNGSSSSSGHAYTFLNAMSVGSDPVSTYSYAIRPVVCISTSKFIGENAIFILEE